MIKIRALVIPMFCLTLAILVVGCSSETEDENIKVIKSVLQQQFTSDQELIEILDRFTNTSTELEDYLDEQYKSYFTENYYYGFIGSHAMTYQLTAHYENYIISVKSIDIKQNEATEGAYNFTVNVIYKKEGAGEKQAKVMGRAHIYEQGKISHMYYLNDNGLYKSLKGM
ncbi:hypothetical protein [Chengkuizengella axinellae]|uniref:Nuclear transport factor 2 family protein n=1 Tax=Chengkuizengella axinellae TaxID=3064388 RepID=A0ABT9J6C3_9BACL|nr:hypothetical protein [Chengkuizengella sp. 2205SS18-9]MDP5277098.1 hypothetical protein [Chengkuizengella sp. 2205SS18-9]